MKKRVIILVSLALILCFSLCACKSSNFEENIGSFFCYYENGIITIDISNNDPEDIRSLEGKISLLDGNSTEPFETIEFETDDIIIQSGKSGKLQLNTSRNWSKVPYVTVEIIKINGTDVQISEKWINVR